MDLSPAHQAVLDTFLGRDRPRKGLRPWIRGEALLAAGHDPEVIEEMVKAELLQWWGNDRDGPIFRGGPFVILTPWGAWRLSAVLVEYTERRPVWRRVPRDPHGDPKQSEPAQKVSQAPHEERLWTPELVIDPAPEPEYLVDEDEKPVTLLGGYPVRIDPRLKKIPPARKKGKRPKRKVG